MQLDGEGTVNLQPRRLGVSRNSADAALTYMPLRSDSLSSSALTSSMVIVDRSKVDLAAISPYATSAKSPETFCKTAGSRKGQYQLRSLGATVLWPKSMQSHTHTLASRLLPMQQSIGRCALLAEAEDGRVDFREDLLLDPIGGPVAISLTTQGDLVSASPAM